MFIKTAIFRSGTYFAASLALFLGLDIWLAFSLDGFDNGAWVCCIVHFALAALINALLLDTVEALTPFCSPLFYFLLINQIYFTVSAVKYFVPNPAYPQFNLDMQERFWGSMLGESVLFGGVVLLRVIGGVRRKTFVDWILKDETLPFIALGFCLISLVVRISLINLDYGSPYDESGSTYSRFFVRSYTDYFLFYADIYGGLITVTLGLIYLARLQLLRYHFTFTHILTGIYVITSFAWAAYLRSRSAFFVLFLIILSTFHIRSPQRYQKALKLFLTGLPIILVLGLTTLTGLLGRPINWQAYSTLELNVSDIGYRSDLTDFALGVMKASNGRSAGPALLLDALTNAVPRFLWSTKDSYWSGAYFDFLTRLGWPYVDYTDTIFSAGVLLIGPVGFFVVPLFYMGLLGIIPRFFQRRKGNWKYYVLLVLGLGGFDIEVEWPLLFTNWRERLVSIGVLLLLALFVKALVPARQKAMLRPEKQWNENWD